MKNSSNSGSTTNTVVAATTSSSSSSTSSSASASSSLGVAVSVTSAQQPSGSLSVGNCELPRWQNSAVVRDPHSSSDTDDCDLDIGRLVIDLEADLDSKACRSKIEMKSSGVVQKSTSLSVPGSTTLSNATPLNSSSIQTAGINSNDSNALLSRATKGALVGTDNAEPSHRSLMKNAQSNSNCIPVSTVQGDLVDRGIKMRIKCSQSTQGSSSSGLTSKHEITQFHSPFLTSSLDNAVTLSGSVSNVAANKATNSQTSQGSGSLGKYNYGRSSHKKDRHAAKDRNKVTGAGRPFVDDLGCNNNANRSSSSHSNCATVASKEATDIMLKSDVLNDGGLPKILTSSADPYEFNMKTEDTVGLPVKKIKLDRCDASNSPIVELCLPGVEKKEVAVDASHIGTITEPECLGPCEPGTSVTLEGIVWNETENGLLVVNVTWRGKTYVGTLMDSTRHHWAPPRFSGDSPTSDLEARTPKGRGKRGRACAVAQRNESNGSDRKLRSNRFGKPATITTAPSPVRGDGNSQKRSRPETSSSDGSRGSKCSRSDSRTSDSGNGSASAVGELTGGGMIECPEENCSKKYRNLNGLRYHQTRAHKLSCASLARETSDLDVGKYINDDLIETSSAVDKVLQKGKNLTSESSNYASRKPSFPLHKLADVHCKTEEPLEEMDLEVKLTGDGTVVKDEDVRETDTISESMSSGVSAKLDTSCKSLSVAIVEESIEQNRSCRGSNSFPVMNVDDPRILEITHQPLLSLTPVPLDSSSAIFEIASNGSRKQCPVSVGQPNDSLQHQSSNVDEPTLSDMTKDRDRARKLKTEKVDRGKLKTSSDSLLRPVISTATVPSTTVASAKPENLPPSLVSSSISSQLKQVQTKQTLSSNHANLDANLAVFSDKGKKRKRDKEKPKERPATNAVKLTSVVKSVPGSESAHSCQLTSQSNAPVATTTTTSNADLVTSSSKPGTEQAKFSTSANVPAVATSTSTESFGQPTVSLAPGIEQTISTVPSDSTPASSAHCSPEAGVLPPFLLCPSFLADQPVLSQAGPVSRSDVFSNDASSDDQATLSMPMFNGHQLLLPAENTSKQPSMGHLDVASSSVIKVTSSFDLPGESKLLSASDADLGGQAVLVEGKLSVLQPGANNDFSMMKACESGVKASQDRVQSVPGLNLSPLSSPYKRAKNAGAKQNEGGSVSEFTDPHSPAYSDISDANDNAPLLDAPMLEKEAQAATEEDAVSSKVSPNNTQDSYVYSPFYGQPPYLTPAVPSAADHSECGPTLKPPLSNPLLDKQQLMDRLVETAREKRSTADSGTVRGKPNDVPPKFPGEQLIRDDKEARDKAGRVISGGQGTMRSDVLKSQQQQQQQQSHKLFSGDAVLPQHMTMMPHMMMPSAYTFGTPFGFFSPEYSEHMQRMYHQHIQQQHHQQQQEARRHTTASKPLAEGSDHGKIRPPLKVSTEGKHSDEKFKPTKFEGSLPTPPSLIPDRNRPEPKEELEKTDRGREKPVEGRKVTKDVVDIKNITEIGGGTKPESFDIKMLSERPDMQRYCLQPHYLEQQQRVIDLQSTKSAMELGAGGCKPSAVVAPQTRDKCLPVGGIIGSTAAMLHCTKQQKDDSQRGRSYDGHRSHRDAQKNQSATPPQQSPQQHKSTGGSHEGSAGRTPKETGERPNVKDDSGASASSRCLKGKEDSPMISLPISMSAGMPAPYAPYYSHYLPAAAYPGAMPFDPGHATLYPGMIGYPPPTYIHPAQMLSPALALASAEGKPCDVQPQPSTSFFSREGQPRKTHEPKEVAKTQQQADRSQPSPGNHESTRPKSRGGGGHSTGKDGDHSSPPTQRHLHTHHHMHVVSPLYQYVHSDAALIASQQAAAATAATQLPRPFLAK